MNRRLWLCWGWSGAGGAAGGGAALPLDLGSWVGDSDLSISLDAAED